MPREIIIYEINVIPSATKTYNNQNINLTGNYDNNQLHCQTDRRRYTE